MDSAFVGMRKPDPRDLRAHPGAGSAWLADRLRLPRRPRDQLRSGPGARACGRALRGDRPGGRRRSRRRSWRTSGRRERPASCASRRRPRSGPSCCWIRRFSQEVQAAAATIAERTVSRVAGRHRRELPGKYPLHLARLRLAGRLQPARDRLRLVFAGSARRAARPSTCSRRRQRWATNASQALLERQRRRPPAGAWARPARTGARRRLEQRLAVAEVLEDRALGHPGALGHALRRGTQLALVEQREQASTTASRVRSARTVRPSRWYPSPSPSFAKDIFSQRRLQFFLRRTKTRRGPVRLRSAPSPAEAGGSRGGPHTSRPRSLRLVHVSGSVEHRRRTGSRGNRAGSRSLRKNLSSA